MMQLQVVVHLPEGEAGEISVHILAREDGSELEASVLHTYETLCHDLMGRVATDLNHKGYRATMRRMNEGKWDTMIAPPPLNATHKQKAKDVLTVWAWVEEAGGVIDAQGTHVTLCHKGPVGMPGQEPVTEFSGDDAIHYAAIWVREQREGGGDANHDA